jgi:penicillin-binding protein 1C
MQARLIVVPVLLAAAFLAAAVSPRPKFYEGMPFSESICDKQGRFIKLRAAADGRYRVWLALSEFSPLLTKATLIEESRNETDPATEIAQSVARRRLGQNGPDGATGWRRARLMLEAWRLRILYSPAELLEAYLNLSTYGDGIDGAGAASLVYFGKNPDQLTVTEAIDLSVLPDHPVRATLTGHDNPEDMASRRKARKRVLKRWAEQGARKSARQPS